MEFVEAGLPQSATDTVLITFNYSTAMFFLYRTLDPLFFSFSHPHSQSFDLFEIGHADTKNFEWISIGIILRIQNIYGN